MTKNRENTEMKAAKPEAEVPPVPGGVRPVREDELDTERLAEFAIEQVLDYELPVTRGD